jgi:hypothetical protein
LSDNPWFLKESNAIKRKGDGVKRKWRPPSPVRDGELELISQRPAKPHRVPTEKDDVIVLD